MTSFVGYRLTETLRADAELVLWRGRDPDGKPVLIVSAPTEHMSPAGRQRLEHEYELRAELHSDWAAKPLALIAAESPALVLEDPGGEPLEQLRGQPLPLPQFLAVGSALADALAKVHENGLIHKDIKPAHVLLDKLGRVRFTGFGIASRAPRDTWVAAATPSIAGTLAYMAPEQTGRMNRSVDARSDLYALGVTLYELLTGRQPFSAADPLEWMHCHLARQPVSPSERVAAIPEAVSAIVLKLLAKPPEERYQSARGLLFDLERCRQDLQRAGNITAFALATHDATGRLHVAQKLYGREAELRALLRAFDRMAASGQTELVLVSGYAGVGKSALVNELRKPIVPARGNFIAGKFDQHKRDIPYATVTQAFRDLVQAILSEPEERIAAWRRDLLAALGANGQLIVDVIPSIELVIGQQAPVPDLPPTEVQNRFRSVFRHFIDVFARSENPLVLFLDDLQWADSASLALLNDLVTHPKIRSLLVVGAYRDNEVDSAHPLMAVLRQAQEGGARVSSIALGSLPVQDLTQLVAETLRCHDEDAADLASLIHDKTAGNPFFAIQFLTLLHDEQLLMFDAAARPWRWDVAKIRAKGYTDNLADLMVGKLVRLPAPTQAALQSAACLGNTNETALLALVMERSKSKVEADLSEAAHAGLILLGHRYKFLHDRVQEAAYALVPEAVRPAVHLRIGRLLLAGLPAEQFERDIFEVVSHFNRGVALMSDPDEQLRVARFNLAASRKARASAAFGPALGFLRAGAALLPADAWDSAYELALPLYTELSEAAFVNACFGEATGLFELVLSKARTAVDRAPIYRLQVLSELSRGRIPDSLRVGRGGLEALGIDLSAPLPTPAEVAAAIGKIGLLPPLKEPRVLAAMQLLTDMLWSVVSGETSSFRMLVLLMARLSFTHGICPHGAYGFVLLGSVLAVEYDRHEAGYRAAAAGIDLLKKHPGHELEGRALVYLACTVSHWREDFRSSIKILEDGSKRALEWGDVLHGDIGTAHFCIFHYLARDPLTDCAARFAERFGDLNIPVLRELCLMWQQFIADLSSAEVPSGELSGQFFDGPAMISRWRTNQNNTFVCLFHLKRSILLTLRGDFERAVAEGDISEQQIATTSGFPWIAEYSFFASLALVGDALAAPARTTGAIERVQRHVERLRVWSANCPANYEHKYLIVEAELARLSSDPERAAQFYRRAIESARIHRRSLEEAVGCERAARFYLARLEEGLARPLAQQSHEAYERFGAKWKASSIRQEFNVLLGFARPQQRIAQPGVTAQDAMVLGRDSLDLAAVLKASQAISREIVLDDLLDTLLNIVLECAGAQTGLLFLARENRLDLAAEADTRGDGIVVTRCSKSISAASAPMALLQYVVRAREPVLLDEAAPSAPFRADEYIVRTQPKSALCLPLLKQARVVGALYLENRLVAGSFTPSRIAMLDVLAAHAAIALQNAMLYAELHQRRGHLERLVQERTANLAQALTELELILNNASLGITLVVPGPEGRRVKRTNHAVERILGYEADELIGCDSRLLYLSDEDYQTIGRAYDDELCRGATYRGEFTLRRKDGTPAAVDVVACALDPTDLQKGVIWLTNDITQRKRADTTLLALNEHLQKQSERLQTTVEALERARLDAEKARQLADAASTAKSRFLATASHDLRQPMHALDLYLGLIANCALPEEIQPSLAGARQCARTMDEMFRALLDISRLDSGTVQPQLSVFPVASILREAQMQFAPLAAAEGLALRIVSSKACVRSDPAMVTRILCNFIANAVRYTDQGKVLVGCRRRGAVLRLAVYDTGPGIAADKQRAIFDEFFQIGNAERDRSKGLGLGLAIVERLAKLLDARLTLVSRSGAGSMFAVDLPLASAPRTPSAPSPAEWTPASPADTDWSKASIVVIDDEPTILDATRAVLEQCGCRVLTAVSGSDASAQLARSTRAPDLLICDYRLAGGVTGIDVVRAIREELGDDIPALLITGDTGPQTIREIEATGFALVHKPIEAEDLKRAARQAIVQSQRARTKTWLR
jgi:PAS domain S-box-containing protein